MTKNKRNPVFFRTAVMVALFAAGACINAPYASEATSYYGAGGSQLTEDKLKSIHRAITQFGRKAGLCDDIAQRQLIIKDAMDNELAREIVESRNWISARSLCEALLTVKHEGN